MNSFSAFLSGSTNTTDLADHPIRLDSQHFTAPESRRQFAFDSIRPFTFTANASLGTSWIIMAHSLPKLHFDSFCVRHWTQLRWDSGYVLPTNASKQANPYVQIHYLVGRLYVSMSLPWCLLVIGLVIFGCVLRKAWLLCVEFFRLFGACRHRGGLFWQLSQSRVRFWTGRFVRSITILAF